MALPGRTENVRDLFLRALTDVVDVLDLDVAREPDSGDEHWSHSVRRVLRQVCGQGLTMPDEAFEVLVKAAVYEPDPSFNRGFVEPALNAFGRRRLRAALLEYLRTGTNPERAGAARAWYWSGLPLRLPQVTAQNANSDGRPAPDDQGILWREWKQAALREFVGNEHVDVRRSILPGLPLARSSYPPDLHDLVDQAVSIARSHPDEYIRHRVEIQIRI
jgi:hypothetical protein